jgi:hypothetical protein
MPRKKYRRPKKGLVSLRLFESFALNPAFRPEQRIFCACAIGKILGELDMVLVIPGTPRPKPQPEVAPEVQEEAPQEENVDVKRMMEELNAADTQSNGSTDQSVL